MNIVNKLTIRHLLLNKKRTLVTMIGIIISVAMITAVSTFIGSFVDMLKREEIRQDGEWHVQYNQVAISDIETIKKHNNTKEFTMTQDIGFAIMEGGINAYKPYVFIKSYNESGFENFPLHLLEGRLPENPNEILIPDHMEKDGGVTIQVGDKITLPVGQRIVSTKGEDGTTTQTDSLDQSYPYDQEESLEITTTMEYTVVGIIERLNYEYNWSPGYTALTYVDESYIHEGETVNVSVIVKKVSRDLFEEAAKLAEKLGVSYGTNSELLMYYGVTANDNSFKGILITMLILIAIIMIGSISLIYNAFSISLSERSRYLGMLASVGATKKQKRSSVYFEGFAVGILSIPLGLLAGTVGLGITFMLVSPLLKSIANMEENLTLVVSPLSILIAVVFSTLTIFLSSYIPARRASRISPIDAIRQSKEIKLTKRKVKTWKLTRILFGFEAELGLKNLKRNRGRYRTTIVSLVISILLFLTVSSFTNLLKNAYNLTTPEINFDIAIWLEDGENTNVDEKLRLLEDYTEMSIQNSSYHIWKVDGKYVVDKGIVESDGNAQIYAEFVALSEDELKEYVESLGIDYKKFVDGSKEAMIAINTVEYKDNEGKYIQSNILELKEEESLPLELVVYNNETGEEQYIQGEVSFIDLTKEAPMGVISYGSIDSIKIIATKETINGFTEKHYSNIGEEDRVTEKLNQFRNNKNIYINAPNPIALEQKIKEMLDEENVNYHINNVEQNRKEQENFMLFISVFVYGFIILITLICVANTFNTISTSITLRKREFAMLKSVGMTPKAFNKMVNYESLFYGLKALLYGLPLSFLVMYLMFKSMGIGFIMSFTIPWGSVGIAVAGVFIIVGITMMYSTAKIRKDNIIDTLKQENI